MLNYHDGNKNCITTGSFVQNERIEWFCMA